MIGCMTNENSSSGSAATAAIPALALGNHRPCLPAASHPQLVNAAKNTLNKQRNDIVNAFAADKKAQGLAAIESLEKALADFDVLIGTNDKQVTPGMGWGQGKCEEGGWRGG